MDALFQNRELEGVEILIVDDDADTRDALSDFLSTFDVKVLTASSGDEAFEVFRRMRPRLLISDIWMQHGDGYSLVRRIRALSLEEGSLTPAIAISAAADPASTLEAGFHAHFEKPFDPLALLDAIREFVVWNETLSATVSVGLQDQAAVLTLAGYATPADMRLAIEALAELLDARGPMPVIADLSRLTGFSVSAANVAERVVWRVRDKIVRVTIVGGSRLARLVARATCAVLGLPCEFRDER